MNDLFSYTGIVTVVTQINNKPISKTKFHNTGTKKLFEAYARALSGQPIQSLIPAHIDIGKEEGLKFDSILKNKIPATVTYVAGQENVYDVAYEYDSPFTRVSTVLTKNMVDTSKGVPNNVLARLETADGTTLAEVELSNLGNTMKTLGIGIQLIILWDLYVVNEQE